MKASGHRETENAHNLFITGGRTVNNPRGWESVCQHLSPSFTHSVGAHPEHGRTTGASQVRTAPAGDASITKATGLCDPRHSLAKGASHAVLSSRSSKRAFWEPRLSPLTLGCEAICCWRVRAL